MFGVYGGVAYFFDHIVVIGWVLVDGFNALLQGRLAYFMTLPNSAAEVTNQACDSHLAKFRRFALSIGVKVLPILARNGRSTFSSQPSLQPFPKHLHHAIAEFYRSSTIRPISAYAKGR